VREEAAGSRSAMAVTVGMAAMLLAGRLSITSEEKEREKG